MIMIWFSSVRLAAFASAHKLNQSSWIDKKKKMETEESGEEKFSQEIGQSESSFLTNEPEGTYVARRERFLYCGCCTEIKFLDCCMLIWNFIDKLKLRAQNCLCRWFPLQPRLGRFRRSPLLHLHSFHQQKRQWVKDSRQIWLLLLFLLLRLQRLQERRLGVGEA